MTGLPSKYAKMGFSKGWKAYRKSKGKGKAKIASRKTKKRKATKTKTKTRRRKATRQASGIIARLAPRRKKGGNMAKRKANIMNELQKVGMGAAGAIGGNIIGNMVPGITDPRLKAAVPLIAGIILSIFGKGKMPALGLIGSGMAIGGAVNTVRAFAPNVALLQGDDLPQIAYSPEDVEQAVIEGSITPEEGAELLGMSESFAGEDDQPMAYAPADEWQTTEDEI